MIDRTFLSAFLAFLTTSLFLTGEPARALVPSLKPAPINPTSTLSDAQYTHFRNAMRAIEDDRWDTALGYRAGLNNSAAGKLVDWELAIQSPDMDFFALSQDVQELQGWPRHDRIQIRAEQKIADSGMTATAIDQWFKKWPAISGEGKIAHADALFALGKKDEAIALLKDGWRNHSLSRDVRRHVMSKDSKYLSRADHEARMNNLLWMQRTSEAAELLSHVGRGQKALGVARIRLIRRSRGVDEAIERVPTSLQTDPGLMFDRAWWRRKKGRTAEALPLIKALPAHVEAPAAAARMWVERKIQLRRAIKDKKYQLAYDLASKHGFTKGTNFADGEWTAGWLALRFLHKPDLAKQHFETLRQGVSTPVSQARALYWLGRTDAVRNNPAQAHEWYLQAAKFRYTYYGQLAQQELGPGYLNLGDDPVPTQEDRARFAANEQVQALQLLGNLGDWSDFRRFSYFLDDALPNAVDHVMLAEVTRDHGQPGVGLRAAKAALRRNEVLPDSLWPVRKVPESGDRPEPALTLAISRQESELYPRAISHVGARGLMQLMPATARHAARAEGMKYRKNWLIDDPQYNLKLGSAHLQDLLDKYDGSYILAAAAYNAGSHRVNQWLNDYGDPRKNADPVDWVEEIPFSETRNYVQRVMENVQVYRNRLRGEPTLIQLKQDLNRGSS